MIENATIVVTLPADNKFAGRYELDISTCTGRDDLDVRRETGLSLLSLLAEAEKDPGLTLTIVCAVAWIVRRRDYPTMLFESVLDAVPWGTDFSVDAVEQDESGKADSGASSRTSSLPSPITSGSDRGKLTA